MDYKILNKIKYTNKQLYDIEKAQRRNSFDTITLPINVNSTAPFVVPNFEIMKLIQDIYHLNTKLQKLKHNLPEAAIEFMLDECLIKEIMITNSIEGVSSTRKEITDIINSKKGEEKKKRLIGMVRKYQMLISDKLDIDDYFTCHGLRNLYNDIVASEIPSKDQPDGHFFRKESVDVVSATGKTKHRGLYPENEIIDAVQNLGKIMNNEKIPGLIKIALIHYFIGYIHPFYDGNGRINRFISSSLLRIQLGKIPATYLSYAIKDKISDYYDAFDISNDKDNCGDLTPFIILFLEFVYDAVSSSYNNCSECSNKLTYYGEILSNSNKLNAEELKVSFLLVQFKLFAPEKSFNESDIINISKLTRYSIKNITNNLLNKGFPITVSRKGREIIYSIDLDALESWS